MKYLIHDMGIDWFKKELTSKYFSYPIHPSLEEPENTLNDYLGWHKQATGKWFVGVPLLSGRLTGNFKQGLRRLVDKYKIETILHCAASS